MQSRKASKNTKTAEETVAGAAEISTPAESTGTPRNSRSSKLKKETNEMGPAKHRKSSSPETIAESSVKTNAGPARISAEAPIIDAVGVMAPVEEQTKVAARSSEISPSHEEIAKLAHSYWIARGYAHGSAEDDWLRAERELRAKR